MSMIEKVKFSGSVKILSISDNDVEVVVDDTNLTTAKAGEILARALADYTLGGSTYTVHKMVLSNLGSDDLTNSPQPVNIELEDMVGTELEEILITNAEYDEIEGDDVAMFQATLPKGSANGKTFTEIGLFTANGDLLAKRHFPSYQKTPERELVVLWGIHFQRNEE